MFVFHCSTLATGFGLASIISHFVCFILAKICPGQICDCGTEGTISITLNEVIQVTSSEVISHDTWSWYQVGFESV